MTSEVTSYAMPFWEPSWDHVGQILDEKREMELAIVVASLFFFRRLDAVLPPFDLQFEPRGPNWYRF